MTVYVTSIKAAALRTQILLTKVGILSTEISRLEISVYSNINAAATASSFSRTFRMPIYAWGSNGSGQLGVGHQADLSQPTQSVEIPNASHMIPKAIAAGGNHTLILDTSGCLHFIGSASGVAVETIFQRIKLCSATWDASILYTTSDKVIVLGKGERGELGCGRNIKDTSGSPIEVDISAANLENAAIVQLASSIHHTVAVLSDGNVIGWGNGRKGQLGEPADIIWEPRKISGIGFKVVQAACGQGFTFLVGETKLGQCVVLGHDKFDVKSAAPKFVANWKTVGATWGSVFVLFEDGSLESWGRNDHAQLASPNGSEIAQIALGSEHALAITIDDKLYAWGWGEHGNCGPDTDETGDAKEAKEIKVPTEVSKIQGLAAGCATSWFWT